jgi:chromate transporter
LGPFLVLVLLACGGCELIIRRARKPPARTSALLSVVPVATSTVASATRSVTALAGVVGAGTTSSLAWVAFKVGALSYGGGFVIIPLMHADAVAVHHWMTEGQFLSAVALGQITPGPVVHTVAVVGYAAAGLGGGLLAAAVAFAPSFSFILVGAERFEQLRANAAVRSFLDGAGPAAIGAIVGAAIPLALALTEIWQLAVLAAAALALFGLRRGVVSTLVAAGAIGAFAAVLGAPLPN